MKSISEKLESALTLENEQNKLLKNIQSQLDMVVDGKLHVLSCRLPSSLLGVQIHSEINEIRMDLNVIIKTLKDLINM